MSGFSIRYNEFNPNDLDNTDNERTLGFAYNFVWPKYNVTVKATYDRGFKPNQTTNPDQFRFGIQYVY